MRVNKRNKQEIKISEILHLAADKYLSSAKYKIGWLNGSCTKEWYSCCAIYIACNDIVPKEYTHKAKGIIMDGLRELGCETCSTSLFKDSTYPQGDRYMWLKFAAIIAEEQEAAGYKLEI